jgi:hyperosmotically inducible protein
MKQPRKRIAATVFLAVVFPAIASLGVAGCAANLPDESAGEYIDDAVITTKVKAAILDQPPLKSLEIHVDTFKGTVHLYGFVSSQFNIDKAVEIARSVNGVRSVKNDLRLK